MTAPSPLQQYLLPLPGSFWRWTDQGRVVSWITGTTLAFREELVGLLAHYTGSQLPPWEPLLLLVGATRDSWGQVAAEVVAEAFRDLGVDENFVATLMGRLDQLHYLPAELRRSPRARVVLLELAFDGLPPAAVQPPKAEVLRQLQDGLDQFDELPRRRGRAERREIAEALQLMVKNLAQLDSERLRVRIAAAVDAPPEPAPAALDDSLAVGQLLRELQQDRELGELARLSQRVLAALTLPRRLDEHERLAVGGVSDLSNRGSLDRLLLSELAQDDDVLTARLALNEALFLERERPRGVPARTRVILVDDGLCLWGTTRLFATSVGLALASTAPPGPRLLVLHPRAGQLARVDLGQREGVLQHLAALEPHADLTALLPQLAEQLREHAPWELVVVTADEVLEASPLGDQLQRHELLPCYLATVSRTGELVLTERTRQGSVERKRVRLAVDALARSNVSLLPGAEASEGSAPRIDTVRPFPLRLCHHLDPARMWFVRECGVFAFTRDRRLMQWDHFSRAARQLPLSQTVTGRPLAVAHNAVHHLTHALIGDGPWTREPKLLVIDTQLGQCHVRRLETRSCGAAWFDGDWLLIWNGTRYFEIRERSTGELFARKTVDAAVVPVRQGIVKHGGWHWSRVSFDGQELRLDAILDERRQPHAPRLSDMFLSDGIDGAIGVTVNGDLYYTATGELARLTLPDRTSRRGAARLQSVSHDGRQVVLAQPPHRWEIDVRSRHARSVSGHPFALEEPAFDHYVTPVPYRAKLSEIGFSEHGVMLRVQGGVWLELVLDGADLRLRIPTGTADRRRPVPRAVRQFAPAAGGRRAPGVRFRVAKWPDGSTAWSDSRGLLHLRSSSSQIPETAIVLGERRLAGWCDDGVLWGDAFYTAAASRHHGSLTRTPAEVQEQILKPFATIVLACSRSGES